MSGVVYWLLLKILPTHRTAPDWGEEIDHTVSPYCVCVRVCFGPGLLLFPTSRLEVSHSDEHTVESCSPPPILFPCCKPRICSACPHVCVTHLWWQVTNFPLKAKQRAVQSSWTNGLTQRFIYLFRDSWNVEPVSFKSFSALNVSFNRLLFSALLWSHSLHFAAGLLSSEAFSFSLCEPKKCRSPHCPLSFFNEMF